MNNRMSVPGGGLREGVSMPSLLSIKDAYQVAESLARADLMTSPSARRRLQARRIELGLGEHPGFVPPKHLLLYLVRMGSLSFSPQIRNKDTEDDDLDLPLRMTKEELLSFCSKELEGTPQLIPRRFRENFLSSDFKSQEYYPPIADKSGIRVLQWNVLSQSLGVKTDKFDCCPDEALKWRRRRNLLTQEIIKYSPDVICLQEVDHFKYLQKTLGSQGYVGHFAPKVDSPCYYIEDNNGPDGCAIFYFADKFELVNTENRVLQVWGVHSNQLALLTNLRNRFTGKEFCVATTHLKARQGALLSTLRNEQGKDLLEFVKSKSEGRPVVLAGDFNAEPSEPVYSTLTTDEELHLGSAYAGPGGEPPYTTWKIREEGEICHTIDYIFYSRNKLRVGDVLEFPSDEEIGKDRVPSLTYPSDHFSLVSDLYPLSITSPL